jgi:hypothetical protein
MLTISRTTDQIRVASPYSPDLPARARAISGRWDAAARVWAFPLAAEPQVRDLYLDVYGQWDDAPLDLVTIHCTSIEGASTLTESLTLGGRVIARAQGRDSGARTAEGVVVLAGGFTSGGSVKNWRTICRAGTEFRVLGVPLPKAQALVEDPEWCDAVIIEAAAPTVDLNALRAERDRLTARITEIDALLEANQ